MGITRVYGEGDAMSDVPELRTLGAGDASMNPFGARRHYSATGADHCGGNVVRITAVHLVGGELHEHIASVRWTNPSTGDTGTSTRESMVEWIEDKDGKAVVGEGIEQVSVGVVDPSPGPKYIRTYADGKWTNNLLALPRY